MLSTTFLLSKTFLLSQFSPPSAAHAFNYNIPFIKNIPFITIYPPLCSPCFQLQHSFYQKHYFYQNFPPLYSPQHCRHTFAFVRPYLTSFYQNFSPPPLQPMLSTTTFLLSKHIHFIKISPPLCSPCFQLQHSFYQKHSFYHNFPPPLRHTFAFVRPYLTSFYQNFPPPLQPMLSTTTFLLTKTFLLSQFSPLCSPCFQLHSFYQNFPPPLQPMLSMIQVTTGLLPTF